MLLVLTKLNTSSIHGIGIFADQFIKKGDKIWEFTPGFDQYYSKDLIDNLPGPARNQILKYAYCHITKKDTYVLVADDARFFNHSDNPNCKDINFELLEDSAYTIAARDIDKGEELTVDYNLFDAYGTLWG
ncbi:MAG: SET domain-containing protein [Iphinoe sp. HA4291-MV1]|jgi:hypothetical protein|nr:SET domain-containing protein [Iphinoe sp. HA4291-MV1]